jgi:hypothetical protein
MDDGAVCEAFAAIADLCIALDAAPTNQYPGCWELRLDAHWEIAFNGHEESMRSTHGVVVQPYHCYVQFNGWPAGVFGPHGGVIAAGELANEEAFLAAVRGRMLGQDRSLRQMIDAELTEQRTT